MRKFNPERELNKIQIGNRNKIILFVISLLVVGIIGYSFALYQVRYSKRIIYTKVAPFNNKDIELAVYLDGSPSTDNDFPVKNSGYVYEKTVCDNSSTAFFDNVGWNLYLKANKKDKCSVYFVKDSSIPNPPELYQGLIPVTFDENGKVLVANPTNNDWYNYDEKRWANAVLVNTTKYNELIYNGLIKEEKYGTEISMSDILQMYVWIPRYKYQLFNAINGEEVDPQEIKIQFESGTTNTGNIECKYTNNNNGTITEKCTEKGTEIGAQNGDWYTHPAFTFGNTELTGIWVGKFETSGSDTNVKIIPDVTPIVSKNVSYMFNASRNIEETYAANYSINKDEIDTHMMKNMEWGAMAYLTQSKYGRCDEQGICTEVAKNAQTYKTGYDDKGNLWNSGTEQLASTTGNMYGIHDTNGDAWEFVMGNMVDASGKFYASRAGDSFYVDEKNSSSLKPDEKYYDKYEYDAVETSHQRGHLGDATRETMQKFGAGEGGWYEAWTHFPGGASTWFIRGGGSGTDANPGIFAVATSAGMAYYSNSFRVVLTAQDGEE